MCTLCRTRLSAARGRQRYSFELDVRAEQGVQLLRQLQCSPVRGVPVHGVAKREDGLHACGHLVEFIVGHDALLSCFSSSGG